MRPDPPQPPLRRGFAVRVEPDFPELDDDEPVLAAGCELDGRERSELVLGREDDGVTALFVSPPRV